MKNTAKDILKFRSWLEMHLGTAVPADFPIALPVPVNASGQVKLEKGAAFELAQQYIQNQALEAQKRGGHLVGVYRQFAYHTLCTYMRDRYSIHCNDEAYELTPNEDYMMFTALPWKFQRAANVILEDIQKYATPKTCKFLPMQAVIYENEHGSVDNGSLFYFLGEIPNNPTHCILANESGQLFPRMEMRYLRHPLGNEQ